VGGNNERSTTMKRLLSIALISGVGLCGAPLLVGCEDTVDHQKSVEVKDDGTKVTKEKKTTVNDATDTVTKTESKDVQKPANP
jgi:hypothetical protein